MKKLFLVFVIGLVSFSVSADWCGEHSNKSLITSMETTLSAIKITNNIFKIIDENPFEPLFGPMGTVAEIIPGSARNDFVNQIRQLISLLRQSHSKDYAHNKDILRVCGIYVGTVHDLSMRQSEQQLTNNLNRMRIKLINIKKKVYNQMKIVNPKYEIPGSNRVKDFDDYFGIR
jgi:hypothetical protein